MDTTEKAFNALAILTKYLRDHEQTDRALAEVANLLSDICIAGVER